MYRPIFESGQQDINAVIVSGKIWSVEDGVYRRPAAEDVVAEDNLARTCSKKKKKRGILDLLSSRRWQRAKLW